MSRIGLAFSSFFRLLFGKKLAAGVAGYLPDELKRLPPATKPAAAPIVDKPIASHVEPSPARKVDLSATHRDGAMALLALLQRDGRLVDFLNESLDGFSDGDIGATARDVHRGCKAVLDQYFTLEPVLPGADDTRVAVPKGFDPTEIRIIGEAKGEPPFTGRLKHHGWRATKSQLPTLTEGVDRSVIAPAEVEL
jgi:Domain of unknown function (DUF2760)